MLWYRLRSLIKYIPLYNTFLLSFFSITALFSELFNVRNVLRSWVFWKNIRDATCCNIAGSHKWLQSICMSSDPFLSHNSEHLCKRKGKKKKAILFLLWCSIYECFFFCLLYHLNFAALSLAVWDWKPAVVFFPPFVPPSQLQRVWISHKIQDTGHMNWVELKWELV